MTRNKIDYGNTIIYKIVCNDLSVAEIYIGHTTQFRQRKCYHKSTCNNINSKKYNIPLYKFIREHDGWKNFSMIEIEKYACNDSNEARARERYYFDLLNATLNKVRPLVTLEELKQFDKEYHQKESYKETSKKYRKEHIDEIKKYREDNKDKIQERKTEKITCSCGSVITRGHISEHKKTFKHISKSKSLFQSSDEIIHA
jgi:hypothetical protein